MAEQAKPGTAAAAGEAAAGAGAPRGVNVKSEIGPLKRVLLHRPGAELLNLTPNTLDELLFDDIPYLKAAQREHDAFAETLRENGVEVVYLERLMAEVLDCDPGLREDFLAVYVDECGVRTDRYRRIVHDYLAAIEDNDEFVLKSMAGLKLSELNITPTSSLYYQVTPPQNMVVAPMPNLYFTRDPFATVGRGVSVNRMYSATRNRETIYGDFIFRHHPDYRCVPRYYGRDFPFHTEGGDVLNLNDRTIALGISQRTEVDAIELMAQNIFADEESSIEAVLAFQIPSSRAFMHLDTVFTQVDYDKFTVHPGILGPLSVFLLTPDGAGELCVEKIDDTLENILARVVGSPVDLIPCGAGDSVAAEREQWNDGSNTLCIAPGTIVVYDRNEVTNAELRRRGLKVIEVPSSELSRGRGGPRCMSMPLWREDL